MKRSKLNKIKPIRKNALRKLLDYSYKEQVDTPLKVQKMRLRKSLRRKLKKLTAPSQAMERVCKTKQMLAAPKSRVMLRWLIPFNARMSFQKSAVTLPEL